MSQSQFPGERVISQMFYFSGLKDFFVAAAVQLLLSIKNLTCGQDCELKAQGVLDFVRVYYQPEGGSDRMYTVNSTTATSATLPNLQCNTKYTISVHVHASGGHIDTRSHSRTVQEPYCISVFIQKFLQ